MKLLKILTEQIEKTTIQGLKFGVNVPKGASLPNPNEDTLTSIFTERDLENWKQDKDPSLEVIIDPSKPWHSEFTIPAFTKGREKFKKGKAAYMDRERNAGKTSGLD